MTRRTTILPGSFLGIADLVPIASGNILAGLHDLWVVAVNPGEIWELFEFYAFIPKPPVTTTGNHSLQLYSRATNPYIWGQYSRTDDLNYNNGVWEGNSFTKSTIGPGALEGQFKQKPVFDADHPLTYDYWNNTDGDQTGGRIIAGKVKRFKK